MICVYGKSGSGKDAFLEELIKYMPEYKICKRPTSKPKRSNGDISHYDYYNRQEMQNENIDFLTEFRGWLYGVYKSDLLSDKSIISIDGKTANDIKNKYPNTILIEIKADKDVRINRCLKRELNPDVDEIFRRVETDDIDYQNLKFKPDYVIDNSIDNIFKTELKNEAKRIGGLILNERK